MIPWTMPRFGIVLCVAVLTSGILAPQAAAQRRPIGTSPPTASLGDRLTAGLNLGVALPQGQFGDFSDPGLVLNGFLLVDLTGGGWITLRFNGSGVFSQRERPISGLNGLSTQVYAVDVGPQLALPMGPVRPYGYATIGGAYVRNGSSLGRDVTLFDGGPTYADVTHALTFGGGVQVPVARRSPTIALDLGVDYRTYGDTEILSRADLAVGGTGLRGSDSIKAGIDLLTLRGGVAVSF